jgi:hypothetical protein
VPGFDRPLLCPSVVQGVDPDWAEPVHGLPAVEPDRGYPFRREPWLFDARIVSSLRA